MVQRPGWRLLAGMAVLSGLACSSAGKEQRKTPPPAATAPSPDTPKSLSITLTDPSLMVNGDVMGPVWLGYGSALAIEWADAAKEGRAPDLFQAELSARKSALQMWRELREKNPKQLPDPYMLALLLVEQSGFLTEYVLHNHAEPGWTVSADVLSKARWAEFDVFAGEHLERHKPQTGARVDAEKGFATPPLAGGGLFTPKDMAFTPSQCPAVKASLAERLERFEADVKKLPARVVTPGSLTEWRALLRDPTLQGDIKARGIHWGSPRVSSAYFIVGFCEIEARDSVRAEKTLRRLLDFNPYDRAGMDELAQALRSQQRYVEAAVYLQRAVEARDPDPCTHARHLRQLGVGLIDLDRLDEAEVALKESLELEPGNKLVPNELGYIQELRQRRGEAPAGGSKPQPTWAAPKGRNMFISSCTNKK